MNKKPERAQTPERHKALDDIVSSMSEELNILIEDKDLDFDVITACFVVGTLFSNVLLSSTDDEDRRVNMALGWLSAHIDLCGDFEIRTHSGETLSEMITKMVLDDSVPATGKGEGN